MSTLIEDKSKNATVELMMANVRAYQAIKSAYDQCDPAIREAIDEMLVIVGSPEATPDEQNRAIVTIVDALFPSLAVDFMDACEKIRQSQPAQATRGEMREEEASFAGKIRDIMAERDMTQEELAAIVGVGQSAISNMLNRNSRPQQRSILKIAGALGVAPSTLWPGIADDGELD